MISSTNMVSDKASRIKLTGSSWCKNLNPNIQPEKQAIRPLKGNKISQEKPRIVQGRAGMRRRRVPLLIKLSPSQQNHHRKFLRHQK